MKNFLEKLVLGFLYVVTIGSCIRMYIDLIVHSKSIGAGVWFNLFVVGLCLVFLSVIAFFLLFTKRPNE